MKQWLGEVLSSETLDEVLHYEVAVLSVTGKHQDLFGDSLLLLKDNDRILRCLLYLEQCPESFINAAIKYLNGLEISADLKVRLEEFKPTKTDPSSV